jgi:hypothetical protein
MESVGAMYCPGERGGGGDGGGRLGGGGLGGGGLGGGGLGGRGGSGGGLGGAGLGVTCGQTQSATTVRYYTQSRGSLTTREGVQPHRNWTYALRSL